MIQSLRNNINLMPHEFPRKVYLHSWWTFVICRGRTENKFLIAYNTQKNDFLKSISSKIVKHWIEFLSYMKLNNSLEINNQLTKTLVQTTLCYFRHIIKTGIHQRIGSRSNLVIANVSIADVRFRLRYIRLLRCTWWIWDDGRFWEPYQYGQWPWWVKYIPKIENNLRLKALCL